MKSLKAIIATTAISIGCAGEGIYLMATNIHETPERVLRSEIEELSPYECYDLQTGYLRRQLKTVEEENKEDRERRDFQNVLGFGLLVAGLAGVVYLRSTLPSHPSIIRGRE